MNSKFKDIEAEQRRFPDAVNVFEQLTFLAEGLRKLDDSRYLRLIQKSNSAGSIAIKKAIAIAGRLEGQIALSAESQLFLINRAETDLDFTVYIRQMCFVYRPRNPPEPLPSLNRWLIFTAEEARRDAEKKANH